jgi:hypothetical protein
VSGSGRASLATSATSARAPACYYYLVTIEDGLFISYLLSHQTTRGVVNTDGKMLPPPFRANSPRKNLICRGRDARASGAGQRACERGERRRPVEKQVTSNPDYHPECASRLSVAQLQAPKSSKCRSL